MINEPIKKTVQLELEVDTVSKGPNKYQGLIDLARAVDSWRIFPTNIHHNIYLSII
jgi:hypothetical protein